VELFFVLLGVSYPGAFIMFAVNDLYDADTDEWNDRKLVKDDVIDPDEDYWIVWGWTGVFTVFAMLPILFFGKPSTTVLGSAILVSAIAYSAPPTRLKASPIGSVVLTAVGGWMLYALGYSFTADVFTVPSRSFFYGLLSHMGVSLGALPDMEADRQAGIETFPLRYGTATTIFVALLTVIVTLASGTVSGPVFWYLVVLCFGLVSMWVFERYVLHFKALLLAGFGFLVVLLYRGIFAVV
jgi:4-hydroxybenzoate polyprenyltransferase